VDHQVEFMEQHVMWMWAPGDASETVSNQENDIKSKGEEKAADWSLQDAHTRVETDE
jgi:hypothetical protein